MQSFSNILKSIQRNSVTDSLRFQEVDQSRHVSDQLHGKDNINTADRAKLYRRDLLVHVNKSKDGRTIHVIFPCKSRQQLDVSTLHDLHLKIRNHNKTPMSYKLTSTTDVRDKELQRLPIQRSTIYVHKLCNDCNGILD